MRALMDDVAIEQSPAGTQIRLRRNVRLGRTS
jgi:hypothetical protein